MHHKKQSSLNENLLIGAYPRLQEASLTPSKYYSAYCQTYLERDLKLLISIKDLSLFSQRYLVYTGEIQQSVRGINVIAYQQAGDILS